MKSPFEFGTKLVFRLIFPGAILAAAMVPLVHWVLRAIGIQISIQYLFPFEVIAWGWLIVLADMQIYMLFEGRRYWPSHLRNALVRYETRRMNRLKAIVDAGPDGDERRFREAALDHGMYPIDEGGRAYVEAPTRLRNILAAFEKYPESLTQK